jgi:hypothetical protein
LPETHGRGAGGDFLMEEWISALNFLVVGVRHPPPKRCPPPAKAGGSGISERMINYD